MAYQSLNIIGSFTAATPVIQQQIAADRDRAEAYRNMLREQVRQPNPLQKGSEGPSEISETSDRMTIGDHPDEGRNPYLFQQQTPPDKEMPAEEEPVSPAGDMSASDHIDTVV